MEDELEAFRRTWINELTANKREAAASSPATAQPATGLSRQTQHSSRHAPLRSHESTRPAPKTALENYEAAMIAEREGDMSRAVLYYRTAFKLDPSIDRQHHKHDQRVQSKADSTDNSDLSFQFTRTLQLGPDYAPPKELPVSEEHPHSTSKYLGTLEAHMQAHPFEHPDGEVVHQVDFLAQDKLSPVLLRKLPDELISHMLLEALLPNQTACFPKLGTVEAFALVCRKARLLTLQDSNLYRTACRLVYRPPYQIAPPQNYTCEDDWEPSDTDNTTCDELCQRLFQGDWRRMWLEQPRIRTDGCFISVVSYVRRGDGENQWIAPSHTVVYFRILRFFPDGQCISLVTTLSPSEIARSIDFNLRMKGLQFGRWQLRGDQIACWELEDQTGQVSNPKYNFEAAYQLKSTSRGKMNKLTLKYLRTVNRATGERIDIELQHNRNFFFSCCKSYEG